MKKRLLGMLAALVICLALLPTAVLAAETAWDGSTKTAPSGSGTETAPYLISKASELAWLSTLAEGRYEEYYIKLTANIVLNDGTFNANDGSFTKTGETAASTPNSWTPLPNASWRVDGNGKSISGLYINSSDLDYVGLFSYLNSGSYVQNLTIKNSYIRATHSNDYSGDIGIFAGRSSRAEYTNCAGENNILSTDCFTTGGIVGSSGYDSFNGCHTSGSIKGKNMLGGLVGRVSYDSNFKNCWNETDIENVQDDIHQSGGIVALAEGSVYFYNCANLGSFSGGSRVGGIVGEGENVTKIKNCYGLDDIQNYDSEWWSDEDGYRYFWRVGTLSGTDSMVSLSYAEDGFERNDNGERGIVPHFTGKGKLSEDGTENDLLNALNNNLYKMDAEPGLRQWVRTDGGYPLPTGSVFVDDSEYYDVWLDGVRVSERNCDDILENGLASYDKTTNTLYLHDGLVVTTPYEAALLYTSASKPDINVCVDGDITFHSKQNVGGGPSIIDLDGSCGGSGNLKIYAPEGKSANVSVIGDCSEYGLDIGNLTLDGDVCLTIRTTEECFAFAYTITMASSKAVLDAVNTYGEDAMLNPVSSVTLPSTNPQKLYEGTSEPLTCVSAFTTSKDERAFMYPRIRIAPDAYALTAALPDRFTVSMATANTEAAVTAWVTSEVRKISGITATNSTVTVSNVVPATAGSYTAPAGTNGSFKATVTVTESGISKTRTINGTITATAYVAPTISTGIKAGTLVNGTFTEKSGAFTCGDSIVFALTYTANGSAVDTLTGGTVSCFGQTRTLSWSAANGCYLTEAFGRPKAQTDPYTASYSIGGSGEYTNQTGSMNLSVEGLTLRASDFEFTPPSSLAYDGTPKTAGFTFVGDPACNGEMTLTYYRGDTLTTDTSKEGTYTVKLSVSASDYYKAATELSHADWCFTITKLPATAGTAPTAVNGLTYNAQPQALVNPGVATGGTIVYSTEADGPYSATIPTKTDADDYTVYWYVQGDSTHTDSTTQHISVKIQRKLLSSSDVTVGAIAAQTYSGSALMPAVVVKDGQKTLLAEADYTVTYDHNQTVGTASVTITGKGNYNGSIPASFTIEQKTLTALDFSALTVTKVYDGDTTPGTLRGTVAFAGKCGSDDISIAAAPGAYAEGDTSAGTGKRITLTLQLTGSAAGNYTLSSATHPFTAAEITKAVGSVTAPVGKTGLVYNGTPQALLETAATSTTGTVQYSLNGTDYSPALPSAAAAGTYTVYCKSTDGQNHTDAEAAPVSVRIAPQTVTVTVCDRNIYVGGTLPSLEAPVSGKDYTVSGLLGTDSLTTAPVLHYDPAEPNVNRTGDAAAICASGADAGSNYTIVYVDGVLKVSYDPAADIYLIGNPETEHGKVTPGARYAKAGSTVTITVTPDRGFRLKSLAVLDQRGREIELTANSNGTYTFRMPADNVTIQAVFTAETHQIGFFTDVLPGDYYHDAVQWALNNRITGGIRDNEFGPGLSTTRAQLVTFLWRAAGCPVANFAMDFSDVDANAYYTEAVRWAASLGIVGGYGNGRFGPDDAITREQMAAILCRFAQATKLDTTPGSAPVQVFKDSAGISGYAVEAMHWAVTTGILQGYDGRLMPSQPCTRAQIVTMLYRLLGQQ